MKDVNIIDLFAGAGGFSLGFEMAGYKVPLAIEKDEWASETYTFNHPDTQLITGDITQIKDYPDIEVDGIIGGPPCQGFSNSGKRDRKDPRNSLFMEFVRFVNHYKPKFFVMENVKGILSMKTQTGDNVKDVIISEFNKVGYNTHVYELNAADYGVPQTRTRVFFIGLRKKFPYNAIELRPEKLDCTHITIEDAIMDLPPVLAGEGSEFTKYQSEPKNEFQKWARNNSKGVYNHIAMRHTPRLVERFAQIKFGQSVADVSKEYGQRKRGEADKLSGKAYSQNNMRPYPDKPSPTIPASFQSNFVHPYYNRNYTAREGARLQSFPDTYIFKGKRTTMSWEKNLSQYQQIGNAVPPLLARAIASTITRYFNNIGSPLNDVYYLNFTELDDKVYIPTRKSIKKQGLRKSF